MFKATGNIKSKRLQEHVDILGAKFKISVVTGPSGSYREEDILRLLAKWCEPWSGTRKWEFILLDAYAPGLTNNVQRLCWQRGYILVFHGGGASMIVQTNETHLHNDVRARFIDLQVCKMLHKTRTQCGGVADCTPEENLEIMTEVMKSKDLHLKAAEAYKHTGTTNAFDGTEDCQIAGDARTFWDALDMRRLINKEVDEVERMWKANEIKWDFKTVMSFIEHYPKRKEMDSWKPDMDDEVDMSDFDTEPYLPEDGDYVEPDVDDYDRDAPIPEHDPNDWVDPHWLEHRLDREQRSTGAGEACGSGQGEPSGGGGGEHHGSGDASATGCDDEIDDRVSGHAARLRSLQSIQTIAKTDIQGAIGEQSSQVVANVAKDIGKKFRASMKGHSELSRSLTAKLAAENEYYQRERQLFADAMENKQKKAALAQTIKAHEQKVKEIKKKQKAHEKVLAAMTATRIYATSQLGDCHPYGGTVAHRKNRFDVLDRIRSVAKLSPPRPISGTYSKRSGTP